MAKSVLGAQMFTLREYLKTPGDIAATCARVRKMGYEAVQVSGFGPIEPGELARILDGEGLQCVVTHVKLDMMKDTAKCVDYHQTLKCKYTAVGSATLNQPVNAASYRTFAAEYSAVAAALRPHGLYAGYHNHSHELVQYGAQTGLQIFFEAFDRQIWFEIDTYWIAFAGGDPAAWIEKATGRLPCVHLKDMQITADKKQKMAEIGAGNLNWPRILEACRHAGVEWYLVERDAGDLDPFESLKVSFDNLRAMGLH